MIQIENYISSFLLKNKYCAISGLGTLELKRDLAQIRSKEEDVYPPDYQITFSPIGVIDDGFATFIANHENVSISKASNDIKTFSQDVKVELRKTGRYEVDGVGRFSYANDSISFVQDDNIDLAIDPIKLYQEPSEEEDHTLADAKSFKDLNYTHSEKGMGRPKMGTLIKYLLALFLLVGIAAAAYFAFKYYKNNVSQSTESQDAHVELYESGESDDTTYNADEALTNGQSDTASAATESSESSSAAPAADPGEYKIAVRPFASDAEAKKKSDTYNSWGHKTAVMKIGNQFQLIIYASTLNGDTVKLKDSLRRNYYPSGTPFMVK